MAPTYPTASSLKGWASMPRPPRPSKTRHCERCSALKAPCSGTQPCDACQDSGLSRQCMFRGGLKILSSKPATAASPKPSPVKAREWPLAEVDATQASPAHTFEQDAAHTIPFFRYFGNTAVAPGLRFVEVELKDDHTTVFHEHGSGNDASSLPSSTPSSVSGKERRLPASTPTHAAHPGQRSPHRHL